MPKLKPGDKVPDFTLSDVEGNRFHLYENLHSIKTMLVFYRGEWCPICNIYLSNLQNQIAQFRDANTQLIALSTDSPTGARNMKQRLGLSFVILPGMNKKIIEDYDLFYNEKFHHNEPAIFIIWSDGTVAYDAILSGSLGRPSVEELFRIVSAI